MSKTMNQRDNQMWYQFWDMHSGGSIKVPPYEQIYIEAHDKAEATRVFYARFKRNPHRVTCTCCGEDYSIASGVTLDAATWYFRKDDPDYITRSDVLVLFAKDITDAERNGPDPEPEGYIWH